MENKIIDSIIDAENQAEKIINSAKEKALKIVGSAEIEAEQMKQKSINSSKTLLKQKTLEEDNFAYNNFLQQIKNFSEESKQIEKSAKINTEKAVKIIIKSIV